MIQLASKLMKQPLSFTMTCWSASLNWHNGLWIMFLLVYTKKGNKNCALNIKRMDVSIRLSWQWSELWGPFEPVLTPWGKRLFTSELKCASLASKAWVRRGIFCTHPRGSLNWSNGITIVVRKLCFSRSQGNYCYFMVGFCSIINLIVKNYEPHDFTTELK